MRLTDEEITDLLANGADLFTTSDLVDTIAALTRERDTAHAAAIQLAFVRLRKMCVARGGIANGTLVLREIEAALTDITPAESQRSYDLRIAEAVSNEAMEWFKRNPKQIRWMENRLVSVRAEVERLKGGPDA